jgi:cell division protein FtsL
MSEAAEPTPVESRAPPPAPRQRGGCVSRFLSALLVVLITTFLSSLVAVVLVYVYFVDPAQQAVADTRERIATSQALSADLRSQNNTLQTQVADLTRQTGANREALGELQQQKATLDQLRTEFAAGASQNATVVVEARTSRDSIALFATAEAGRAALLDELERRSDRIERFLQRLSDISADTALDLEAGTPRAAQPTTSPTGATATPAPTPSATPTLLPTAAPTNTTTPERATPSRRPTASSRSTSVVEESPTP